MGTYLTRPPVCCWPEAALATAALCFLHQLSGALAGHVQALAGGAERSKAHPQRVHHTAPPRCPPAAAHPRAARLRALAGPYGAYTKGGSGKQRQPNKGTVYALAVGRNHAPHLETKQASHGLTSPMIPPARTGVARASVHPDMPPACLVTLDFTCRDRPAGRHGLPGHRPGARRHGGRQGSPGAGKRGVERPSWLLEWGCGVFNKAGRGRPG